jgi:ArsR family transcriptional regulator
MNTRQVEKISKALGDPYRLKIMEMIKQQNDQWMQCSCVLQNIDLAQSTISHHINQLVDADLLIAEKDGRNARYRVNKQVMAQYVQFLNVFSV